MSTQARIDTITARLLEFYDGEEIEVFMNSPQILLDGRKPIDLINEGKFSEVEDLLTTMEEGAYL